MRQKKWHKEQITTTTTTTFSNGTIVHRLLKILARIWFGLVGVLIIRHCLSKLIFQKSCAILMIQIWYHYIENRRHHNHIAYTKTFYISQGNLSLIRYSFQPTHFMPHLCIALYHRIGVLLNFNGFVIAVVLFPIQISRWMIPYWELRTANCELGFGICMYVYELWILNDAKKKKNKWINRKVRRVSSCCHFKQLFCFHIQNNDNNYWSSSKMS